MPVQRVKTLTTIAQQCGGGTLRVTLPQQAWAALAEVRLKAGVCAVALHVGPIGRSGRGRDDVERRMQNPGKGKPIQAPPGHLPLLIGLWDEEETPVLVGMDATRRIGDETRKSLFVPLAVLRQAQVTGWVEHTSTSGERIIAFAPALLRNYVTLRLQEWAAVIQTAA